MHLFVQDDQRPVASAKIGPTVAKSRERPDPRNLQIDHVIVTMTEQPLECRFGERTVWTSPKFPLLFSPLPRAPDPRTTAAGRLTEAKMLARRFTAQVDQITAIHASSNREQRLLPTPIYRYGSQDYSKDGTVDGVLFVFTVEGGNPTTFLHLEVNRQKESIGWQYAISRRGVSGLEVTCDCVKVWEVPHIGDSSPQEILYRIHDPR